MDGDVDEGVKREDTEVLSTKKRVGPITELFSTS